jgi:hypothetical protein
MTQDEFTCSMMDIIDTYYDLKRSRTLLKAFWSELSNFSLAEITEEKVEELNDLIFLLDSYDKISSEYLNQMGEIVSSSESVLAQMREAGEFIARHE